ncbi:MAG TPA: hypothetical protein VML91_10905 [Burkholderiales bacterium]|nr:hypothetical protein [Burkholderiales bacterium]
MQNAPRGGGALADSGTRSASASSPKSRDRASLTSATLERVAQARSAREALAEFEFAVKAAQVEARRRPGGATSLGEILRELLRDLPTVEAPMPSAARAPGRRGKRRSRRVA